jgi:hypothetical protein
MNEVSKHRKPGPKQPSRALKRRGALVVLAALLLVLMVGLLAYSIDVGYMVMSQTELQRSLDAAALAGAGAIADGADEAEEVVRQYFRYNEVGNRVLDGDEIKITRGFWDVNARKFVASNNMPSAMHIRAEVQDLPFFFAPIFNHRTFDISGEAVAMYLPREIMIVLDYSGSMNDDSELRSISKLGRDAIEDNLREIYEELGSPTFGNMQWDPVYISSDYTSSIRNQLGLNNVPYPYPSGSWNDYIYYVRRDSYISRAGYRKKYGYLTFINYLLQKRPMHSQTPDLWKTSEQPITAVKDAVKLYLAYLQEVDTDDRVGLVIYTHPNNGALLETGLTNDFSIVEDTARQRQAGHYNTSTNIGAGLREARKELDNNARPGAFKLIVLMTDGVATSPYNTSYARQFAINEAQKCANAKYPVVTVSLGSGADTGLMDYIANLTGGIHFNVPGGQTVAEYEEELKDVFREIADHRPLRVVK